MADAESKSVPQIPGSDSVSDGSLSGTAPPTSSQPAATTSAMTSPSPVEIPSEVMVNVEVLTWPNVGAPGGMATVYLVGTAHVSESSCEDVRVVINAVRPSLVFLELCEGRIAMLNPSKIEKPPPFLEVLGEIRRQPGEAFPILFSWMYSTLSEMLEVRAGEEFRVGAMEGRKLNSRIVLGDRFVQVTIKRFWAHLSGWQKLTFCFNILSGGLMIPRLKKKALKEMVEQMKDEDFLTQALAAVGDKYPPLQKILIDERNEYMVEGLHVAASSFPSVVAVVGRGHLPGMRKIWERTDIDVKQKL